MKLRRIGSKKGALDVSINAIVVIIFAITMLSLGLAFMRGTFGKIGGQVDGIISNAQLDNPPSAENPFVLSANQITVKKGQTTTLKIGYYNDGTDKQTVDFIASCPQGPVVSPDRVNDRGVNMGDSLAWQVSIKATNTPNTYTCSATATPSIGSAEGTPKYADFFVVVE